MSHWTKKVSWERGQLASSLKPPTLLKELESMSHQQRSFHPDLSSSSSISHSSTLREIDLGNHSSLCLEDILTSPETLDFLHHYLPDQTLIPTTEFLSCLALDFPHFTQIPGFAEELITRITVDPEFISLNRLQIFTQEKGLAGALNSLAEELDETKHREKEDFQARIVEEMTDLNELLTRKSKELAAKEALFETKNNELKLKEQKITSQIQGKLEETAEKCLNQVTSKIAIEMKKLQNLEKNINDHFRALRNKSKSLEKINAEKPKNEENSRLKTRLSALEKSNEYLKMKNSALEDELNTYKSQIQRFSDEIGKIKAKNLHLEQILQDFRAEKSKTIEKEVILPIQETVKTEEITINTEIRCLLSVIKSLIGNFNDNLKDFTGKNAGKTAEIARELVPKVVEILPICVKTEGNEAILRFFYSVLTSIFAENCLENRHFSLPNMLIFPLNSEIWRSKVPKKAAIECENCVLYRFFADQSVQNRVLTVLSKSLKSSDLRVVLEMAVLVVLLGTGKKVETALRRVKSLLTERRNAGEVLLGEMCRGVQVFIQGCAGREAMLCSEIMMLVMMQEGFRVRGSEYCYTVPLT